MWLSVDPLARTVVPKGYCLDLSLQTHCERDPVAAVLYHAMHGRLSAHAVQRMASVVQGMEALFEQMSCIRMPDTNAQGCFSWADVSMLLQRLLPGMSLDVQAILEQQVGSCMAQQHVQVCDLVVPGEDCTVPQWGNGDRQPTMGQHAMDSALHELSLTTESAQHVADVDVPEIAKGNCTDDSELQVEAQGPADQVVAVAEHTSSDHGGCDGSSGEPSNRNASRPGSSPYRDAEFGKSDTVFGHQPCRVVVRLLAHYAGALMQLQSALSMEMQGLEEGRADAAVAHADVLALLQGHMPPAEAAACASLWMEMFMETGSSKRATAEMLARGTVRCKEDLDFPAAQLWLQGLQERGAGHSSLAALPQVA